MSEAHLTSWGFAVAAADAVLTVVFLLFGWSLARHAWRRSRAADYRKGLGRFRWWLAATFLAMGTFLGWITLAWAKVWPFHEPTQAILLWVCAIVAAGAYWHSEES